MERCLEGVISVQTDSVRFYNETERTDDEGWGRRLLWTWIGGEHTEVIGDHVNKEFAQAGERAQWVKCSPCKCEDLSLIPALV